MSPCNQSPNSLDKPFCQHFPQPRRGRDRGVGTGGCSRRSGSGSLALKEKAGNDMSYGQCYLTRTWILHNGFCRGLKIFPVWNLMALLSIILTVVQELRDLRHPARELKGSAMVFVSRFCKSSRWEPVCLVYTDWAMKVLIELAEAATCCVFLKFM